jgi:lipid-A-disaccharide synthase-like uncharacterized protein
MDFFAPIAVKLALWWANTPTHKVVTVIGIAGQLMFSLRWIQQWLASERAGTPTVPAAFWYYSLLGGLMVLLYGIYFLDPVVILAQFGVLVYARNIYLLHARPSANSKPGSKAKLAGKLEPEGLRQKKP